MSWTLTVNAGEKNGYIDLDFTNNQPALISGKKYLFMYKTKKFIDYLVAEVIDDKEVKIKKARRVNLN